MEMHFERMVADHLENGFLENIIDMLKQDKSLFRLIPFFLNDRRQRVRIGAIAIIESLLDDFRAEVLKQLPEIGAVLKTNRDPVVRGDAIYLLSIVGDKAVVPYLKEALFDPEPFIQQEARDTLKELEQNPPNSPYKKWGGYQS